MHNIINYAIKAYSSTSMAAVERTFVADSDPVTANVRYTVLRIMHLFQIVTAAFFIFKHLMQTAAMTWDGLAILNTDGAVAALSKGIDKIGKDFAILAVNLTGVAVPDLVGRKLLSLSTASESTIAITDNTAANAADPIAVLGGS